jgi:uncharacterized protein (TIGR03435 family)
MKNRIAVLAFAGLLMAGATPPPLRAQASGSFEVASIKPHPPGDRNAALPAFLPGGRFHAAGVPLFILIAFAYNIPFQGQQLAGGPDWIRSAGGVYDIEAKADPDALTGLSDDARILKMRSMLQTLLADRFHLAIARDVREQPVYLLTVAKNGPKLQPSKLSEADCQDPSNPCYQGGSGQGRGIHVKAYSMPQLVVSVSNFTDHPLLDRTGLKGLYDIDTDGWVPMRPRPVAPGAQPSAEDLAFADPARPTLYQIFDKLGLKMDSSRAAVEMFVISSVDKPSEN